MKFKTLKNVVLPEIPDGANRRQFDTALRDKLRDLMQSTREDLDRIKYTRNLVKNGSFELWSAGLPVCWNVAGGTVTNDDYTIGIENPVTVEQKLAGVKKSAKYSLLCYVRGGSPIIIVKNAKLSIVRNESKLNDWGILEGIFETTEDVSNVVLSLSSPGAKVNYDNIEVYEFV